MRFKPGDVVSLNFEVPGPAMTVARNTTEGVKCMWFDDHDTLHEGFFPEETLELEIDGEKEKEKEED